MGLFQKTNKRQILELPISDIRANPHQPRRDFTPGDLAELAMSISQVGILQPLSVRRIRNGWELIAGERRLRAAVLAGLTSVPCLPIEADDDTSALLALVENLQRKDLDLWEEAAALRQLIDRHHLSQEEAARKVGKSQSAVANKLRLLKLPQEALAILQAGGGTERHARALLRLETEEQQLESARRVVDLGLTVAQTEALVDSLLAGRSAPPRKKPTYIIKDVRLFLNTISRSLDLMRSAGVDAQCSRQDTEELITLTIQIPRAPRSSK